MGCKGIAAKMATKASLVVIKLKNNNNKPFIYRHNALQKIKDKQNFLKKHNNIFVVCGRGLTYVILDALDYFQTRRRLNQTSNCYS